MSDGTVSGLHPGNGGVSGREFPLCFGLDTFGDVTNGPDGNPLSHAQTIRNVVEQGVLVSDS